MMNSYNFIIGPTDTDSVSFCKADMSPFSEEERQALLKELNDISPELIEWEDDGYYKTCIALRAKNYVLWDGQNKITKGSGFKTSSKEPAMKDLMNELVDEMLENNDSLVLTDIYNKYVVEAHNVKDIRRWCAKKTITRPILDCKGWTPQQVETKKLRMNEISIWEAVKNEDIFEGDKVYLYPTYHVKEVKVKVLKNGRTKETPVYGTGLSLDKHYDPVNSNLDVDKLVSRCYNTVKIFSSILDIDKLFINYSLNKNKELLQDLLRKK